MSQPPQWPRRCWVKSSELAAIAEVAERTVLREIERGHLPAERYGGWIIEKAEARKWLGHYKRTERVR
jgi:hypothetical protein